MGHQIHRFFPRLYGVRNWGSGESVLLFGRIARGIPTALPAVTILEGRDTFSKNVSSCPGYTLSSLQETQNGLTAKLDLGGAACNAYGHDIANLTLEVSYDTTSRLHVNIYDTDNAQFTIPSSLIELASPSGDASLKDSSDLVFNYDSSPFAFWITRRSEPDSQPLFDTRISSLPPTPIAPKNSTDATLGFDGFPLVFEDQYLQLTSALPLDANIYGIGEAVASSGFRRDMGANGTPGTIQTNWARDAADPVDENMYGSHTFYLEHRYNATTSTSQSHGVFVFNAAGSDTLLQTPPSSPVSLVQYRLVGGTLDMYFFSGPSPKSVVEQYGALVGLPTWQPEWGLGFHLCRWGYSTVNETKASAQAMRDAGIPLETMWNDIDLYHAYRDFTTDPVSFPADQMKAFIEELAANNQHYIPIVDAGIAHQMNATDIYDPFLKGTEKDIWMKNPDGSTYIGQVWPGYTVFADFFHENTQAVWTEALTNWSNSGVEFSGIWLDMNEISSFCTGSCGSDQNLPSALTKRGLGAGQQKGVDVNYPPYPIHNGAGLNNLAYRTLATNATHANGMIEIDTHNLYALMEERATHLALLDLQPGKRPFIIGRGSFPSAGKWTGHWLGDNFSRWSYLHYSIQGILQFQLFQIPMVGADTCGFNEDTNEELCNRWMQLGAFSPFYRNHNSIGSVSQEPYRWESVANASKTAIAVRYSLLNYWYTLFANASTYGTPTVRALWFEFPEEPELFGIDRQYLVGRDILVTPVLDPNVTTPGYTTTETRGGPWELLVSLDKDGRTFGTAYVDDGESLPPTPHTDLTFWVAGGVLFIESVGNYPLEQKLATITVLGATPTAGVSVKSGNAASETSLGAGDYEYDKGKQKLVLKNLALDLNGKATVTWG
uniref:Neutral alpha-glucosidase AB n=1 Tax=Ganoderma boninense TaxID=34458 RepID=A0A5K1K620_9APHY|nr:Neutral alpha-glucosidase AB [Ganoderma boninense]